MSELLLDTHIFLHFINGDEVLSKKTISLLNDKVNRKFLSIASIWEMTIKIGLGKLAIVNNIDTIYNIVGKLDFSILHITKNHLKTYISLPEIHRDPFDKLITSQAIAENLTLVTDDRLIKTYPNLKLLNT
jgi:PIN domain nuclease of toxin-antitoxin system